MKKLIYLFVCLSVLAIGIGTANSDHYVQYYIDHGKKTLYFGAIYNRERFEYSPKCIRSDEESFLKTLPIHDGYAGGTVRFRTIEDTVDHKWYLDKHYSTKGYDITYTYWTPEEYCGTIK